MLVYLPFGDWSGDGHGQCENMLVDINSGQDLLEAEKAIKAEYGDDFFESFANGYEEPTISNKCWQALSDNRMPVSLLRLYDDKNDWSGITSIEEARSIDPNPRLGIEFIKHAFIWLLNCYGANIILGVSDIPQINNWTCPGFETVGYGCFCD